MIKYKIYGDLMNNKNMFSKTKEKQLKPFIIAFGTFFLILFCCSFLLFMHSIDYDFNNLIEKNAEESVQKETESSDNIYSVSTLTGKCQILFVVKDDTNAIDLCFLVITDFDEKNMQIEHIDDRSSTTNMYIATGEKELKEYISTIYDISVDKYVIFTENDFKSFLSKFDGITIKVPKKIDFKSNEYNLLLEQGEHNISGDMAYKLLKVCEKDMIESILCDITNSVLTPKFINKADSLFKMLVNSSSTDISIIDYTDNIESLKIYSNAKDKFKPTPYTAGG